MRIFLIVALMLLFFQASAQRGADTLHYKKVYYFAGTGIAMPLGKTKEVLSPKLFAGSMGLDISLKNPKYYVYPALYMFSFAYDQKVSDPKYTQMIENGQSNMFMLNLSAGSRRQFQRLNTYAYIGPSLGLVSEPRSQVINTTTKIDYKKSFAIGSKIGIGADYKFKGFFLGGEVGYMRHFTKIQDRPFNALTIMFGLKSDITKISGKVVDIISSAVNTEEVSK